MSRTPHLCTTQSHLSSECQKTVTTGWFKTQHVLHFLVGPKWGGPRQISDIWAPRPEFPACHNVQDRSQGIEDLKSVLSAQVHTTGSRVVPELTCCCTKNVFKTSKNWTNWTNWKIEVAKSWRLTVNLGKHSMNQTCFSHSPTDFVRSLWSLGMPKRCHGDAQSPILQVHPLLALKFLQGFLIEKALCFSYGDIQIIQIIQWEWILHGYCMILLTKAKYDILEKAQHGPTMVAAFFRSNGSSKLSHPKRDPTKRRLIGCWWVLSFVHNRGPGTHGVPRLTMFFRLWTHQVCQRDTRINEAHEQLRIAFTLHGLLRSNCK